MRLSVACAAALLAMAAAPAQAAQICAWMLETAEADDVRALELWLEADADMQIYYQLAGEGLVTESMRAHSPSSGTFVLHKGKPDKPWGFSATLTPPGPIDVVAEIRENPVDIFSDEPPPLMASFDFKRSVPEGETAIPPVLAARQCKTINPPAR